MLYSIGINSEAFKSFEKLSLGHDDYMRIAKVSDFLAMPDWLSGKILRQQPGDCWIKYSSFSPLIGIVNSTKKNEV